MNITNRKGPRTEPCRTPDRTSSQSEKLLFITVLCLPSRSHDSVQLRMFSEMPRDLILLKRHSCGTLSNAFAKSRYTLSSGSPVLYNLVHCLRNSSKLVVQERLDIMPCCVGLIRLYFARYMTTLSRMTDFINLQGILVRDMGR